MRDKRRAEDDYRDHDHHRIRYHSDRRPKSPSHLKYWEGSDVGVEIKGRAKADRITKHRSRREDRLEGEDPFEEGSRHWTRSPHRRHKGEASPKLSRRSSEGRYAERHEHRSYESSVKRRRDDSRSPPRRSFTDNVERRKTRSPARFGRPERISYKSSGHRERSYSPLTASRADHHSSSYHYVSTSAGRSARDIYTSSTEDHHRRRNPHHHHHHHNHRSDTLQGSRNSSVTSKSPRLTEKNSKIPKASPEYVPTVSRKDWTPKRDRELTSSTHYRISPAPERYPSRQYKSRSVRKRSRSWSPDEIRGSYRHKSPRSPFDLERTRSETQKMQSSTRPIQSILDESPRPPSPPRPIPSFDSDSHESSGVREQFPMHGLKAGEMHGAIRPGRPQIDTRQSYSTSPQWTPTSSHHGSPQSTSPFGHARGGWAGQPQHFHNQTGYVCLCFVSALSC